MNYILFFFERGVGVGEFLKRREGVGGLWVGMEGVEG